MRTGCPVALLAVTLAGCANLPDVTPGVCGNGVVEAQEDCDTFAPTATTICLPPGAIGACHLDCRQRPDGTRPPCPGGWGCDAQNVCRPPTGDFDLRGPFTVGGAWSLLAGDFDGDGRTDVASVEAPDLRDSAKLRFHYFDTDAALAATAVFPKMAGAPSTADLSQDGRGDVAFIDENFDIAVLLGQSDRTWIPETAGSDHFPNTGVRVVSVSDELVETSDAILGLTAIDGVPGLFGPDEKGVLRLRATLPGPIDALAGDPVTGDLVVDQDGSPCRELVVAERGSTSFSFFDTCLRDAATSGILWRQTATEAVVALTPRAAIDAGPQIVDLNGDGHLDVLLGAGGSAYIAFGDGHGLAPAVPYVRPFSDPTLGTPATAMPLAAGDFTGDGIVDFVFGDHLLVSFTGADGALAGYAPDHINQAAPWTTARIADLNGNGIPDVVAASQGRVGLDFFNGTGSAHLSAFSVPTDAPVRSLAIADMDGDLVNDLVFVETAPSAASRDSLMIAFGAPAGPPLPPRRVASIDRIDQLVSDKEQGLSGLIVAFTETVNGTSSGGLAFFPESGDRLPFAPHQLVNVSQGTVFRSFGMGLTLGRFQGTPGRDALMLAVANDFQDQHFEFWLLPSVGSPGTDAIRLAGGIDPMFHPLTLDGLHIGVSVAATAADLDGDGRDEAAWAMPAGDALHCGLLVVGLTATSPPVAVGGPPVVLAQPCAGAGGQLAAVDADGDGAVDLALLTGEAGAPGRQLLLLWNDGTGRFDAGRVTTISAAGDSPEQFTVLPASPGRPTAFAYVTERAAVLVATTSTARLLAAPRPLATLQGGTGIVAADLNGDGVVDLALAASGSLMVLKAQLATQ